MKMFELVESELEYFRVGAIASRVGELLGKWVKIGSLGENGSPV